MSNLELDRFYKAANPSKTLDLSNPNDVPYYIDFSPVRGSDIIRELGRTITLLSGNDTSCQLFTGHIGCGKSTELYRLKDELEKQGFHLVYFESSVDLDMADVDVSDILLAIARQVSESMEKLKIKIKPGYFTNLFMEIAEFLHSPIEFGAEAELSLGIAKITAKTKDSPKLRSQLRQYLEPRTNNILESINRELLDPAKSALAAKGKKGLVVIIDNLDRVDDIVKPFGRTQPEYLFVDRGEQLKKLNCHVVYTIPLPLMFSNDFSRLCSRFGVKPKVLPMVPVQLRDGQYFAAGMNLLQQMILARAFPQVEPEQRLSLNHLVFDSISTLDRLCQISGGHVRNLLVLLYSCLQQEDPPFTRECLESVIRIHRDDLAGAISDDEWYSLVEVVHRQNLQGEEEYQRLLRSMFIFEYRDQDGRWFGINPALAETKKFQQLMGN